MDLTNRRRRPLHLAVLKKQPSALAVLLELGANPEALDESGLTALDQAGLSGEQEMAQLLVERGAEMRLPAAIALQRTDDIESLLRKDPECLKPGNRWGTLIVRASERSAGHVVESLIRAGASVNVRDDPKTAVDATSGYTPLHGAACYGNADTAAVLLKHGTDVRAREERYHGTPAGWAHYLGHPEVRDQILQGAIDIVEAVDFDLAHRIPGILDQEPEVLDRPFSDYALYPLGAEGWYTPLAFAVVRGHVESVRVLIDRGADRTVCSPDGRPLLDAARESGSDQIASLLERGGLRS